MTIRAAADGSALGNPGPAGWAWYVDDERWASGGWSRGTNNMGELMAVLDLLQQTADADEDLLVLCDSTYVINVVTQWTAGWKRKGWRKKDGKPVLNVELIRALDEAMATPGRPPVRFEWVKGHAGHELNEAADRLAVAASTAFREGRAPQAGPGWPESAGRTRAAHPVVTVGQTVPDDDLFSSTEVSPVEEVVALERALLDDAVRSDLDRLEALLDERWSEIGASGRLWNREDLRDLGPVGRAGLEVLEAERLADDVVLLVWRSRVETGTGAGSPTARTALRSSVWVRRDGRWRQRFHQGTPERSPGS